MSTHSIRAIIQKLPVVAHFAMTPTISWASGIALIASGATGLSATPEEFVQLLPVWGPPCSRWCASRR